MKFARIASACGLVVAILLCVCTPSGAAPRAAVTRAQGAVVGPTAEELERFVTEELEPRLRDEHVPGAVVSVVHDGEMVMSDGVGLADVERRVPFDPGRSLVRIASISKLFTWTGVMQLAERGDVDLDADVRDYLPDGIVPDGFDEPITLDDLMAHTAGFEEHAIGLAARSARDVAPLAEFLDGNMPARIRPPGQVSTYSNHGAALAGLVTEQVTGMPWQEHVQADVLDRLAMARTTAIEPVPDHLADDLASAYDWTGGSYEAVPFIYDRLPPDGSISSTAEDMARFMLAHLGDGPPLLRPDTLALMHERSFSLDPRVDGYAHGFKERTYAGHRVLMHDGSWQGFQSALLLFPGLELGLFVSTNSYGGVDVLPDVVDDFVERFVPERQRPPGEAPAGAADADPDDFEGYYQPTRHNDTTVERVLTLGSGARLSIHDDGVTFRGDDWAEIGPLLYQEVDGQQRMALVAGPDGERYIATDGSSFEAVPAADTARFNLAVLALAVLPTVLALGWPIVVLRRRRRGDAVDRAWRHARRAAVGASLLAVLFIALLVTLLAGDTSAFVYGVPTSTRLLMTLPVLFVLGGIGALALTVRSWPAAPGALARVHQVTLLVGVAAFGWFALHWNLVPWNL